MEALPANDNRGPAITAIFWVLTCVAAFVVAARFYARWLIRNIGVDDWMILFSWVLLVITSAFITHVAQLGGFRHLMYVPLENASDVARGLLLCQVFNIAGFGTSKFAVGYQLLRVLERTARWRKATIWVIIVITLLYNVIEAVLTMFQCTPAKAAWDPFTKGTCWNMDAKMTNIYVGGVYNVVTDVVLALFPLSIIWALHISLRNRIRLCIVLGLGLFAAVCGSIKLKYVNTLRNLQDLTWQTYELDVWSGAELFVIIVTCSIPPLHGIWQRKVVKSSSARSSYNSKGSQGTNSWFGKGSERSSYIPPVRHSGVTTTTRGSSVTGDEAQLMPFGKHYSVIVEQKGRRDSPDNRIAARTDISIESSERRAASSRDSFV
ncbi:hypothetical protein BS50DRAFT_629941 [Corynespora cassiicola Philippines]|uniref:Rhodopsin domain-containing protein n=1 Tax=Corynespora cassiicola Philippines TaxID=1448308 RepID=A0A2T2P2B6_CORCC|nr:hypothetical protein BS50DRAFT_629941 [Corynespora cassiicola Philippines]